MLVRNRFKVTNRHFLPTEDGDHTRHRKRVVARLVLTSSSIQREDDGGNDERCDTRDNLMDMVSNPDLVLR